MAIDLVDRSDPVKPGAGTPTRAGIPAPRKAALAARDRRLHEVIERYRQGPRELWGPVLLETVGRGLAARLARYRPLPPAISREDIAQQLVLEVLETALAMPLVVDCLERRLLLRAGTEVTRWLKREARRQGLQVPQGWDPGQEPYSGDGDVSGR